MNNRNYGNYNHRAFSPPRMNPNSEPKQFYGSHASQPYFQYQNHPQNQQPQRNSNNNNQNMHRESRFDDHKPSQSHSERDYISFSERQSSYDRNNERSEKPKQSSDQNRQNYHTRRSNFNPSRPKPSSTSTSSQPAMKLKFNDIFTISRRNENGVTTYNCKLCKLTNLPEQNLGTHVTGKRHKHHVKLRENASSDGSRVAGKMSQFKSTGGQLFNHRPMFDSIIREVQQPLVALTYTVEILDQTLKEPSYVCVLCSKRCDPRTVVNHLISQTHRMNYFERHFPRLITVLHNNRRFNEDMPFRQHVLINVAKVLEETFGRSSAFVYDGCTYDSEKDIIFDNINKKKHITQEDIPDVEGVLLEGINLENTQWEANNPPTAPIITENHPKKRRMTEKVIEDYSNEVRYATEDLEKKLENYQNDPESHPFYRKEWELFWNRKVDEVTARGGDPKNCNFHGEWCDFFLDRMKDLHREEMKWKIEQLRRKFGLTPADIAELNSVSPKRRRNNEDDYFSERKGRFNNDDDDDDDEDYTIDEPRIPKDQLFVKEKNIFEDFLHNFQPEKPAKTQPNITLITTLRLLSSLEAELGLLAPKVLDLLSKSLAVERENPKSSDDLLNDSENLNLIETVKEKILGMQAANLISSNKQNAVQKAIFEIENLIEKHEVMAKVKASLREMGKTNASSEEIEMLMGMVRKKSGDEGAGSSSSGGQRGYQSGFERNKTQQIQQAMNKLRNHDRTGMKN